MNLYEHTIIARQDTSPTQIKELIEKYSEIIKHALIKDINFFKWLDLNYKNLMRNLLYQC